MAQITYTNKQFLNQNSDIADINKVNDSDMNEIKNVVNENDNTVQEMMLYSNNEVLIGYDDNDNAVYRKIINTGALPNSTQKLIPHNISNLNTILKIYGIAYNNSTTAIYPLPYISVNNLSYQISLYIQNNNIIIGTAYDRTDFTESYVTLEYTKTS